MIKFFAIIPMIYLMTACSAILELFTNPVIDEAIEEVVVETVKEVEKLEGATGATGPNV